MPEKPSDTIESIAPSLPTPIRGRARRTVLDDPANRPAILIDGPVPQVRMRSGRKLRRAQQVSHWTRYVRGTPSMEISNRAPGAFEIIEEPISEIKCTTRKRRRAREGQRRRLRLTKPVLGAGS